tara:strand:- start:153 stop:845 length:693 start_codon:yes stop_codon:yes gene_type:complete
MWAIVPVKTFVYAKQRLRRVLDSDERAALSRVMLEDVLSVLSCSNRFVGVAVVTGDIGAVKLSRKLGARVISDPNDCGQSSAVSNAVATLIKEDIETVAVIPGDVPLVTSAEIDLLHESHNEAPSLTVAPAHNCDGTNALLCSPPTVIQFKFGENSLSKHISLAKAVGIVPNIVRCEGLGLDIDTPSDLMALIAAPTRSRAQSYLHDKGIALRVRSYSKTITSMKLAESS